MSEPEKTCESCGRRIEWRKKWERDWDQVRYCSQACRRRGVSEDDLGIESTIRELVMRCPRSATVSEQEVALAVSGPAAPESEAVRRAVRRLVAAGEVEIVQRGRVVDPSTARGPIAFRTRR